MESIKVEPGKTRVGWIGTGVMGAAMCGHIMDAGFSMTVYNRTISKADGLKARGAVVAESPKQVGEQSDVVFSIVGFPADVRQVILGESGVLAGLKPGGVIVDMTTSEPSLSREIFEAAQAKGCNAVDAPVSGGDKGAKAAKLAIMAGGREETVAALAPLLNAMGNTTYMGPAGNGQHCKMANQITIASTMVGMVEGMLYAHKAGLDVPTYLRAISSGAAASKSLELYSQRILQRDFDPGFFVAHFVKDLGIALNECQRMGLSLPGLALAQSLYVSLKAHEESNLGTQALVLALERLNNTKLPTIS
ncbi:6-phosphogluconate dehydrogenase [Klebsormidium nitens]|uniref:6-phosphogluconate dehydrogenase n=1 Tax=Klebsormidium nitens TaxID=105231 RepID=A0A1Y1HVU7_KLENI|nr:6-phosphogluconate dehydrogenase [Klebsormidium nitens]|eukprot:GAQ79968.1 6-phosphogluconate dehydrogenase [Klebsormidium nitens]